MDSSTPRGRGSGRGTRTSGDSTGPSRGRGVRRGFVRHGKNRGRGRDNDRTNATEASTLKQTNPVDPAELYTYIDEFPNIRPDRSLEWKRDNKDAIGLGTILRTSMYEYYEPEAGGEIPTDSPSIKIFPTERYFEACIQKIRRFIVIDKTDDIFVALPIFTYGRRGLEGKPAFFGSVHLHVRDLRRETQQSKDQILATEDNGSFTLNAEMWGPLGQNEYLDQAAHCRFNYPVTFNLLNKWVRILGRLTEFSAKKLFVRHHQSAARRLAPPQHPGAGDSGDSGDDNGDTHATELGSGESTTRRTSTRRGAPTRSPLTPLQSPQGSSAPGPALSRSPTRTVEGRSLSATETQKSPGLHLSGLALTSPGKRHAESEANDRSSSRSSKRQNRSSGSNDLMELDNAGRPRRQPQSRSGSATNLGTDHGISEMIAATDALQSPIGQIGNLQNSTMENKNPQIDFMDIDTPKTTRGGTDTVTTESNQDKVDGNILRQTGTVTEAVNQIIEPQQLDIQHNPINTPAETTGLTSIVEDLPPRRPNAVTGSLDVEGPAEREIAIMRAAYRQKGDQSSKDKDFIIRALLYNNNKHLNRIRELTARGRTDHVIEDEIANKMGYPGSIGSSDSVTWPGAGAPMTITLEEKDIEIAVKVLEVTRESAVSTLQPCNSRLLEDLREIRSNHPDASEDLHSECAAFVATPKLQAAMFIVRFVLAASALKLEITCSAEEFSQAAGPRTVGTRLDLFSIFSTLYSNMAFKKTTGKRKFTPFLEGTFDEATGADLGDKLGRSPRDFPFPSKIQRAVSSEPSIAEVPKIGTIGYGTIIQTTFYDQWTPSAANQIPEIKYLAEKSIAQFRWGQYAIQKLRWCVVLHVYSDSYVVLPIYTHGGTGIRNIPLMHRNNFLKMYDPRAWGRTKPETLDDPNNRDLHTDMHGSEVISRDAWVRATFPISLSLLFKPVKVVGYLTPTSAQKLRNYFDRRPWDRQIMTPVPATNARLGIGAGRESQRSSGGSDRQTRSQGPADPIELGPNKCVRLTPGHSRSQSRTGSSGGGTTGEETFRYNPKAYFRPRV